MLSYDLLIIGAGPVGASLACALASTGWRIGLIEAKPYQQYDPGSPDVRTLALAYGSCRILQTLGVWPAIVAQADWPIEHIEVTDRGHIGQTQLHAHELGVPALGHVVPMPLLVDALHRLAKQHENITFYQPAELKALDIKSDIVNVEVANGKDHEIIKTKLLVGADGADSIVRRLLGIRAEYKPYSQSALISTLKVERPRPGTAFERFTPEGPLALLPMRDRQMAMVWTLTQPHLEQLQKQDDAQFLQSVQQCFGDKLGKLTEIGRRRAFPLTLTKIDKPVCERVVLIGNAAHSVHPVAGQGFNLGLRDAAVLADVLVQAQAENRPLGDAAVLQRYADMRRRDNRMIQTFTDGLIRVFGAGNLPAQLARSLGLLAVDNIPPLKRQLLRITSGLAGHAPRLARGLPVVEI